MRKGVRQCSRPEKWNHHDAGGFPKALATAGRETEPSIAAFTCKPVAWRATLTPNGQDEAPASHSEGRIHPAWRAKPHPVRHRAGPGLRNQYKRPSGSTVILPRTCLVDAHQLSFHVNASRHVSRSLRWECW